MITITETAKKRILALMEQQSTKIEGLRMTVKGMNPPEYRLDFVESGKEEPGDTVQEANGIKIFMEPQRTDYLEDVKIDFINSLEHSGFKIENPKVVQAKAAAPPQEPANLDTPEAQAVQKVLDTQINPAVAGHGGYIGLVDVRETVAYIRMGGGCQGCGMANVTLKQGVIVAIKKAVPAITEVLDVTDHAGGNNPYYSPGK
ncbi:MAG TPA: iron-sulfur cluster assembly accessory protein [Nitrospiria bacterium]|nr:iron-sulfur cluster assembly accessory protein [Nitrospiria bacterium]